jgi:beta-lactam-binding protein with PASTA domain
MKRVATGFVIALSAIGFASPAAAEPAPTPAPAPTFSMPSVTDVTLAKALDSVDALSPDTQFRYNVVQDGDEPTEIQSPGSWVVCRQSPAEGSTINAKTRITLRVERPWYGC